MDGVLSCQEQVKIVLLLILKRMSVIIERF
jgi:hypothetical protein